MEILKDFGVNPILLGAQIINFLIVFYLLKRFLYKPVLDVLRKREDEIKKGLQEAEKGKKLLEETEKKILRNARLKADEMVKNAKAQGEEILRESDQKAKKQSEKILLDAKDAIEQESAKAEKELMENVGKLAIEMLEKSMTNLLDRNQQKAVLKKASDQIKEVRNE